MIIMASDHRGYMLKEAIKTFFNQENIITIDVGSYSKEPVDYPDFAKLGIDKVLENKNNVGIFICGSGIGMSIAANRNPKIRAGLCLNTKMATLARKDNDANVLCMPGNMRKKKAIAIIKVFLTTSFEGGRHARRLKKISGDIKYDYKPADYKPEVDVKVDVKPVDVKDKVAPKTTKTDLNATSQDVGEKSAENENDSKVVTNLGKQDDSTKNVKKKTTQKKKKESE